MLVVVVAEGSDDIIRVSGMVYCLGKLPVSCHVMYNESSLGLAYAYLPSRGTGPGRCEVARLNGDRTLSGSMMDKHCCGEARNKL
jgi:hypothetical protein